MKRMYEINNQGKAKIKMKNEENINNKNSQAQKILGKAVTWWECRKPVGYFLGIVHVLIPHSLRHIFQRQADTFSV